jgi:hypothetical protein
LLPPCNMKPSSMTKYKAYYGYMFYIGKKVWGAINHW